MTMSREERHKLFDTPMLNAQSRHDHEQDVKNNAAPKPFFRRRKDDQHPSSARFEKRWS